MSNFFRYLFGLFIAYHLVAIIVILLVVAAFFYETIQHEPKRSEYDPYEHTSFITAQKQKCSSHLSKTECNCFVSTADAHNDLPKDALSYALSEQFYAGNLNLPITDKILVDAYYKGQQSVQYFRTIKVDKFKLEIYRQNMETLNPPAPKSSPAKPLPQRIVKAGLDTCISQSRQAELGKSKLGQVNFNNKLILKQIRRAKK